MFKRLKVKNIQIRNSDNTTNQIQVFGPSKSVDKPIVLILPAMAVKASYYESLAAALVPHCIPVTTDLRGHGNSSVRPSLRVDFGYKEMIEQDIHSAVKTLKAIYREKEIYLLGHSLGGQLACLYAARQKTAIEGLILIACCSVYYKKWPGFEKYKTLLGTQFIGTIGKMVGYYPGETFGFGGLEAKTVVTDWSNQSRTGDYVVQNSSFDYEEALGKMKVKTLAISFEADTLAPEDAVEHLYLKFNPTSPIDHRHLRNDHPLNDNFSHFNWAKKPQNIVTIIKDWGL